MDIWEQIQYLDPKHWEFGLYLFLFPFSQTDRRCWTFKNTGGPLLQVVRKF
jgi:hypothetical protein